MSEESRTKYYRVNFQEDKENPLVIALLMGLLIPYLTSYFVLFCVKEKMCQFKHLQLVSGTAVTVFWFAAFLWDFLIFMLITCCLVIAMMIYKVSIPYGIPPNAFSPKGLRSFLRNYRRIPGVPDDLRFCVHSFHVRLVVVLQATFYSLRRSKHGDFFHRFVEGFNRSNL